MVQNRACSSLQRRGLTDCLQGWKREQPTEEPYLRLYAADLPLATK